MKQRNDFKIFEGTNRAGTTVWHIKLGGNKGQIITTCRSKEQADEQAKQLNIDPYYFDRGFTRAHRVASHTLGMKEKQDRINNASKADHTGG